MLPMTTELLSSRKRQRAEEVQAVSFSPCPPTDNCVKEYCEPTQPFLSRSRRSDVECVITRSSKDPTDSDIVCFGMLTDLPVKFDQPQDSVTYPAINDIRLDKKNIVYDVEGSRKLGKLEERLGKILRKLTAERGIEFQLYFQLKDGQISHGRRRFQGQARHAGPPASLRVIIYGPFYCYNTVGDFLTECSLYLQDPFRCDRNVLYCNPHLLSYIDEERITTFQLNTTQGSRQIEESGAQQDPLTLLRSEKLLPETEPSSSLVAKLYSHQKQALTFMLRREEGWALDSPNEDIWGKEIGADGQVMYINNVTRSRHHHAPPDFKGGLLADQMGLGKTLSIISLIVSNPVRIVQEANQAESVREFSQRGYLPVKTTLIIMPLHLLETWDAQVRKHVHPQKMRWRIYHGADRNAAVLGDFDIVLTTYKILSLEWKRHSKISLFSYKWHRIVLDEAHLIKNRTTSIAKASCALHTGSRWAVSGTPIQNQLKDLASIFEFLQVYPFSDLKVFEAEISKPWRHSDRRGFCTLKAVVDMVTLCRTKKVINLPDRTDETHYLEFNTSERQAYDDVKNQTVQWLQAVNATDLSKKGTYLNALQWLNSLRRICNHGLLHLKPKLNGANIDDCSSWDRPTAQKAFENMIDAGVVECAGCSMNPAEAMGEDSSQEISDFPKPRLSACLCLLCGFCLLKSVESSSKTSICGHSPKCPTAEVSMPGFPTSPQPKDTLPLIDDAEVPPKLKALMADLESSKVGEKSVVFSGWTYTLDLVESKLRQACISYTRIDGQISAEKRTKAVKQFQENSSIRVILVSICCGGTGLDLTAASKAYLLEPQWNPMMEEQALCRIHRIGQEKDVVTIRYIIKDSWEEKVRIIQDRKKDLANLTFSNTKLSEADIGAGRLQYLRDALG